MIIVFNLLILSSISVSLKDSVDHEEIFKYILRMNELRSKRFTS